jgi:hypothetical protein
MATNNSINAPFPFTVVQGGTGVITLTTPYGVLCAGTTATGAVQTLGALGASGTVLTSNGAGALPSFQANAAFTFAWTVVTATTQAIAINNGYVSNNAGVVTMTLPSTAAVGSIVEITGLGAGGWAMAQPASTLIHFGNTTTTTGVSGSLASTNAFDSVRIVCVVANTTWLVLSSIGNLTVV